MNKQTTSHPVRYHISVHIHPLLRTDFDFLDSLHRETACTLRHDYHKTILPPSQNRVHGHHEGNTILKYYKSLLKQIPNKYYLARIFSQ